MTRMAISVPRFETGQDEVHVWVIALDGTEDHHDGMRILSPDEQARAARFHFAVHRRRYVLGRAGLRRLLGVYVGADPAALAFRYGPHGKPSLDRAYERAVAFNLANSGGTALVAVTPGRPVGVDLEVVRTEPLDDGVAERFFSATEVAALARFAPSEQPGAFARCWTRKEAFLKARGDGLTLDLDAFDVTLDVTDAALTRTAWAPEEAARWSLHDLGHLVDGHAAALAVRGPAPDVLVLGR